jgi:Restriction endonuclease
LLDNVLGNYLEGLNEREFDVPFMALLRAQGFNEIHLLHGAFEFGKDFIAQRTEAGLRFQYVFQTKAGNIGLSEWNSCRGQIDLLRTNCLAHPGFDAHMPRKAVFLTTGRLVGAASLAAQDYAALLNERNELEFTLWDKEKLIEFLASALESVLSDNVDGCFLSTIGAIDQVGITEADLERFSRRWITANDVSELYNSSIEAGVICNRLRRTERLDLACYVSLCLIRAAWASCHGQVPPRDIAISTAEAGRDLFVLYATELFARCRDDVFDPISLIWTQDPSSADVTYPTTCLRLAEIVGLLGLLQHERKGTIDPNLIEFVTRFCSDQPGISHPISDHWAVSLIPPLLLLAVAGRLEQIRKVLLETIRWLGNRYEGNGVGLAPPMSSPDEEIRYLFGGFFEHVTLNRRTDSFAATIILDLASIFEMGDIFEVARNDFLAVDAQPSVVEADDILGQYMNHTQDTTFEPNMAYSEAWKPKEGWKVAPHHLRGPQTYYLQRINRLWDHLVLSAVLRDRHFIGTCRRFFQPPHDLALKASPGLI